MTCCRFSQQTNKWNFFFARYSCSKKTKFVRLFFGRIYGAQICLRFYLTFTMIACQSYSNITIYYKSALLKNPKDLFYSDFRRCKWFSYLLCTIHLTMYLPCAYVHIVYQPIYPATSQCKLAEVNLDVWGITSATYCN